MDNLFIFATRNKLRFNYKGSISVEELWDLNVKQLDSIYKTLKAQEKEQVEESLLKTKDKADETLEAQIQIIEYIFNVKTEEAIQATQEREKKAKKQRLMEVLKRKEDQAIENMSAEEIEKMLQEMD